MNVVAIVGTGTEIGKTWLTVQLAGALQHRGSKVVIRKPIESFTPGDQEPDSVVLARATAQTTDDVCSSDRSYPLAMAPPIAAKLLERECPSLADLLELTLHWPANTDFGLVETIGGIRSPMAADGDVSDFIALLRPSCIVLVADAGLGAINAVRLARDQFPEADVAVFLNRFDRADQVHVHNRAWLVEEGISVCVSVEALAEELVVVS